MSLDQPTINAASKAASETLQLTGVITALAAACSDVREMGDYKHAIVPQGFKLEDISAAVEKQQPTPRRKSGSVTMLDLGSLMSYCADQHAASEGYIYADPDARTVTAIFNDQRDEEPGWRDHRAVFKAEFTPEFQKWFNNNKQPKSQTEFAEFIEDNFADLQGADATLLLNVATTIQATTGINFASAKRLQDGQVQLTYNEMIDAKAGADGALKIPQTFTLGIRIFKNGTGYKLTARLKYRLAGGGVKFWFELDRPERAIEDAFAGYVAELREKSGYTVLIGKP